MSTPLLDALAGKEASLKCEEPLLKQAKCFYGLGFNPGNLTASQMAAVADLLKAAGTLAEAQEAIANFLDNQLNKLRKK